VLKAPLLEGDSAQATKPAESTSAAKRRYLFSNDFAVEYTLKKAADLKLDFKSAAEWHVIAIASRQVRWPTMLRRPSMRYCLSEDCS
jgi:hypothetical protein